MSEQPPVPPGPTTVTIDPAQRVNAPAIGLLVFGIIGVIFAALSLVLNVVGTGLGTMMAEESGEAMPAFMSGTAGVASSAIGLLIAGYIIYAASKMKKLESWTSAVVASILSMIPCVSPCCIIGLPVGIWCLVILFDNNVKTAFR